MIYFDLQMNGTINKNYNKTNIVKKKKFEIV